MDCYQLVQSERYDTLCLDMEYVLMCTCAYVHLCVFRQDLM